MIKKLLLGFLVCYSVNLFGQTNNSAQIVWKTDPFDHKVFIENQGQFNNDLPNNANVLFEASFGKIKACFTTTGLTYRFDSIKGGPGHEEEDENPEAKVPPTHTIYYMSMTWVNSNSNVTVIG